MSERLKIPNNFAINEGVFREGQQALHPNPQRKRQGVVFTRNEQLSITELLMRAGIDIVELGAPVDSPYAVETARALIDLVNPTNTVIAFHGRCKRGDLDAMVEASSNAQHKLFNLYIGTSPENRNGNGGRSIEATIDKALGAILYLREKSKGALIRFSTEDAFRTPRKDLLAVLQKVAPHVDRIGLPDTTGKSYPEDVYDTFQWVMSQIPGKEWEFHGHTDRGLGVEPYRAALRAGANVFSTSLLGLGERTGSASTSAFFAAIYNDDTAARLSDKYDLTMLPVIDRTVANTLRIPIPHTNPLTADGAFTHGAGVHYNAHKRDNGAYSGFDPHDFGRTYDYIVASAVVGGATIMDYAADRGYTVPVEIAKQIAGRVREQARLNGGVTEEQVHVILNDYL